MARRFSIGEAIGEPFRLAFRRPVSTLVWGLASILPSWIGLLGMGPLIAGMIERGDMAAASGPGFSDFDSLTDFMAFQAWGGLANLLGLAALVLVTTAIVRSVPAVGGRARWAGFRLSKDELHVAVIGICVAFGALMAFVIGAMVIAGLGVTAAATGSSAAGWAAVLLGFALALGLVLLWGRLALMAPAAVITGELAFEQGWRAGRGQTGRLFVLMLGLIGVSILIGVAMMILFVVAAMVFGGGLEAWADEAAVEAWMLAQLEKPLPMIAVGLVLLPPLAWVQGFSTALWTAPYAVAARGLVTAKAADGADADRGAL